LASIFRKQLMNSVARHVGVPLIYGVFRLVGLTLRHRRGGNTDSLNRYVAAGGRSAAAFFHGDSFVLAHEFRQMRRRGEGGVRLMASQSRDGELMARFLKMVGARLVRGSSSRGGGRALIEMVKTRTADEHVGLAVDGPRGPRHRVKEGIVLLARRTELPICPMATHVERKWVIRSWDRMEIPKPFSRTRILLGELVKVPPNADAEAMERVRMEVEKRMLEMKSQNPFVSGEGR
jgi:lysophospholipid acyltransferase (LPLAT)-like uncharacterized protein